MTLQGKKVIININGETVARYSYDAWGKCTILQDTTTQGIANINPFRYRGYYLDRETDLYYLNSRYYDANTGRFINADSPEYVSVQGGNLFEYCGNCPTKNADYFGFCYVPTYEESALSSGSGKKKGDGLLEAFIKVISVIGMILGASATKLIAEIRRFLNENPWIQQTLSVITFILYIAAIVVLCFFSSSMVAPIIVGAAVVAKTIDNIITIVTFDPKSIGDYISLIISLIIPKVVTKGLSSLRKLKIPEKAIDFISEAICKLFDIL